MARGFNYRLEQQQAPAFFVQGPSPFARLVFFAALSLLLMATDAKLHYLDAARYHLHALLQPFQLIANKPSELYRGTTEYLSSHNGLLKENRQLKQRSLQQQVDLQKLNLLALENAHLKQLLDAKQALSQTSVLGEILHISRDPFAKKILVNRGAEQQVLAGQAVVDALGVIGQVTRTYPSSSEVTLITDKTLAIPVQVERNGLRAIAFGHGRDNTLDLPFLPTNVDIRQGDKLITSGIDGIYPAGLSVANVTQIEITPDSPFARIVCVPTGGVENHRQVLLVSVPKGEDYLAAIAQEGLEDTSQAKTEQAKTEKPNNASTKPAATHVAIPHGAATPKRVPTTAPASTSQAIVIPATAVTTVPAHSTQSQPNHAH